MVLKIKGNTLLNLEEFFMWIAKYGYMGLFLSMFLGIVGLPVPDEILMVFAGYMASEGKMDFIPTCIAAGLGSFCGMSISFMIGKNIGFPILEKLRIKFHFNDDKMERFKRWFLQYGKFAVAFGYFVPGFRHITPILAGINKWSFREFIYSASIGGLVWVLFFVSTGIFLGPRWRFVLSVSEFWLWIGFGILITLYLIWRVLRRYWGGERKSDMK